MWEVVSFVLSITIIFLAIRYFVQTFFAEARKVGREMIADGEKAIKRTVRECAPAVADSAERVIDSFGRTMKDPKVQRTVEGVAVTGLSILIIASLLSPREEKGRTR